VSAAIIIPPSNFIAKVEDPVVTGDWVCFFGPLEAADRLGNE